MNKGRLREKRDRIWRYDTRYEILIFNLKRNCDTRREIRSKRSYEIREIRDARSCVWRRISYFANCRERCDLDVAVDPDLHAGEITILNRQMAATFSHPRNSVLICSRCQVFFEMKSAVRAILFALNLPYSSQGFRWAHFLRGLVHSQGLLMFWLAHLSSPARVLKKLKQSY